MTGRWKLTPVGAVAVLSVVIGLLLLILGGSTVIQVIGIALICAGLLGFLGGQPRSQRMAGFARPGMKQNISSMAIPASEPAPEYVADNPEAPDSVWDHERELYHEKEEREHPHGDPPATP